VLLLVHDTKPPFLEGKALSGRAAGVVLPLKDPTSDMAVIARCVMSRSNLVKLGQTWSNLVVYACRNGSSLVKEVQEKKEKDKSRLRCWDMLAPADLTSPGLLCVRCVCLQEWQLLNERGP
jgi:pre-mRNA-splicing factor ATP-dependent RNA helicase DHX38/PRP16